MVRLLLVMVMHRIEHDWRALLGANIRWRQCQTAVVLCIEELLLMAMLEVLQARLSSLLLGVEAEVTAVDAK
jgi:hypothetical protein